METEIEILLGYTRENENFGDYVREIYKHMTAADVRDAIKRANLYGTKSCDKLFAVHKACDKVAELKELSHGSLAHWAALGVESLTGGRISLAEFKTPRNPWENPNIPYEDLDTLRSHVEEEILNCESNRCPWGEVDLACVRAWLSQTPYQIWLLVEELEEWGQEALREAMFDMAREQDNGRKIAHNIQQHWDRALMDNWKRDWKSRWDGSVPAPLA